jgi:two-component system LytT family sensor kinase
VIKLNDKGFRITSIIALFLLLFFLRGWNNAPFSVNLAARMLISLFIIAIICEGNRWLIIRSHYWFNAPYKWLKRVPSIVLAGSLLTGICLLAMMFINNYLLHGQWEMKTVRGTHFYINGRRVTNGLFFTSTFIGFLFFWIFYIIYETRYHFARLRYMEKEKDRLEKEKLKAELHHLKEMVNPHFLFNTLNSLSALISENPRQAEIFLDELTRVYRYLLRNNEVDVTTLTNELQFMRSYFHLLKTRYGEGIHFITDINLVTDDYLLPPLTLQLLVENAVKHNRLTKGQPLTIHLFTTQNNELVVSNNIQKKDTMVDSTRVGLKNINAKYNLLQKPGIVIDHTGDTFAVTVPLIESYRENGSR